MADGAGPENFLGVRKSLTGRVWRRRAADESVAREHQLRHGLSEPLARALASRGVTAEGGGDFLNPTLKALFPDPSSFADMDRAVYLTYAVAVLGAEDNPMGKAAAYGRMYGELTRDAALRTLRFWRMRRTAQAA